MKVLKKIRNSHFIGKNLARFKMGMGYYTLFMSTITAVGVLKTAFESISIWWMVAATVPLVFGATIILGYLLDKWNVNTMETFKTNEMSNRYLLTSDIKSQEFQLIQTQMLIEALIKINKGENIDYQQLLSAYNSYKTKWMAKDE